MKRKLTSPLYSFFCTVVCIALALLIVYLYETRASRFSTADMEKLRAFVKKNEMGNTPFMIAPDIHYGSFYSYDVVEMDEEPGSIFEVAQKQPDGSFRKLFSTQEGTSCEYVDRYHIPHQVSPVCIEVGKTLQDADAGRINTY